MGIMRLLRVAASAGTTRHFSTIQKGSPIGMFPQRSVLIPDGFDPKKNSELEAFLKSMDIPFRREIAEAEISMQYDIPMLLLAAQHQRNRADPAFSSEAVWFAASFTVKECYLNHRIEIKGHSELSLAMSLALGAINGVTTFEVIELGKVWGLANAFHRAAYGSVDWPMGKCFEDRLMQVKELIEVFAAVDHGKLAVLLQNLQDKGSTIPLKVMSLQEPKIMPFAKKEWTVTGELIFKSQEQKN